MTGLRALLACLCVVILPGCGDAELVVNRPEIFRFKISAVLQIDGSNFESSAIQELQAETTESFLPTSNGLITKWRGQAVTFEVKSGLVLVLMAPQTSASGYEKVVLQACELNPRPGETPSENETRIGAFEGRCEFELSRVPMTIWIPDTDSATGMERVDGGRPTKGGGPDVKWISGTIETSNEALSFDLRERLPWLTAGRVAGSPLFEVAGTPRPVQLGGGEFVRDRF